MGSIHLIMRVDEALTVRAYDGSRILKSDSHLLTAGIHSGKYSLEDDCHTDSLSGLVYTNDELFECADGSLTPEEFVIRGRGRAYDKRRYELCPVYNIPKEAWDLGLAISADADTFGDVVEFYDELLIRDRDLNIPRSMSDQGAFFYGHDVANNLVLVEGVLMYSESPTPADYCENALALRASFQDEDYLSQAFRFSIPGKSQRPISRHNWGVVRQRMLTIADNSAALQLEPLCAQPESLVVSAPSSPPQADVSEVTARPGLMSAPLTSTS